MFSVRFILIVIMVLVTLASGAIGFSLENNSAKLIFYVMLVYSILSVKVVNPDELGAILFLGEPQEEVSAGPNIVPLGFFSLAKETALVKQEQYPAEPEKIDKTDSDTLAPGKFFPIRVTTGDDKKSEHALDKAITTEVTAISRIRVKKGSFITFLTTIGDMGEAHRQIRDTVENVIKIEFPKKTPRKILAEWSSINQELKRAVIDLTSTWGIEVKDVYMVDVDLGETVNKALRNVPAAQLRKDTTIIDAEGERIKRTEEGEGAAAARLALLKSEAEGEKLLLRARAIGIRNLAKASSTTEGQIALWLETMKEGFSKSKHTIIPGGELFSATAGIKSILEKIGGPTDGNN